MQKFELNRLISYSAEEIVAEIQRVAALVTEHHLTGVAFERRSKVSRSTVNRFFGSWKNALCAAGLENRYSGTVVTEEMRSQRNRGLTDVQLLSELQRIAEVVKRKDISSSDIVKYGKLGRDIFGRRFGSLSIALAKAGLCERRPGVARQFHSRDRLFENLLTVWTHHGRQPHYSEMDEFPSEIRAKNYWNRFGTWRKALLAFVASMDEESGSNVVVVDLPTIANEPQEKSKPRGSRSIPLGLRFAVLKRDNFRCLICGGNPPSKPGLVLHVDHIVPWSKGGRTEIENLRTLCAPCNIGRSNKLEA